MACRSEEPRWSWSLGGHYRSETILTCSTRVEMRLCSRKQVRDHLDCRSSPIYPFVAFTMWLSFGSRDTASVKGTAGRRRGSNSSRRDPTHHSSRRLCSCRNPLLTPSALYPLYRSRRRSRSSKRNLTPRQRRIRSVRGRGTLRRGPSNVDQDVPRRVQRRGK